MMVVKIRLCIRIEYNLKSFILRLYIFYDHKSCD